MITFSKDFRNGLRDGVPIGLGYFSVAFTFGLAAVAAGLPVWGPVLISMTNVTSAGQFAGLQVISVCGAFLELALSQLIINMRYALMSLSLSQKLDGTVRLRDCFCEYGRGFCRGSWKAGRSGPGLYVWLDLRALLWLGRRHGVWGSGREFFAGLGGLGFGHCYLRYVFGDYYSAG